MFYVTVVQHFGPGSIASDIRPLKSFTSKTIMPSVVAITKELGFDKQDRIVVPEAQPLL